MRKTHHTPTRHRRFAAPLAFAGMIAACAVAPATFAQEAAACSGPVAEYRVSWAGDDRFHVEGIFVQPSQRWDLAFFPLADRPEGQAASIRDVHAFAADGLEVPVTYIGEAAWTVPEQTRAVRIAYDVMADHGKVDWGKGAPGKDEVAAKFDASYVFAGHAFFLFDWDMPRCPVDVSFDLPEGWVVTAPWRRYEQGWRVDDGWAVPQNMFGMGRDLPVTTRTGGLDLTWLISSDLAQLRPGISAILDRLPQAYTDLWGEAPGERFAVFLMGDSMSDGGAFYDSFALRIAVPLSAADQVSWSHTLGHEVMHLWNRLGKAGGQNVPELEWVNEGFTDYLTIKTMSQAGLLEPAMAEQRVANIIRRYNLSGKISPGVSLRDSGKNKQANWQLVYGGGALVAMLLDAELSRSDPGGLSKLLRRLRAAQGKGFDYDRLLAEVDAATEGKGSEIVSWIDSHPDNGQIVARLASAGLDVSMFGLDEAYVRFPVCAQEKCPPAYLAPLASTGAEH